MRQDSLIAIGSNEQNGEESPITIVVKAIRSLVDAGLVIRGVSRFFSTPCFPAGAGPDYVNACVRVQTDLDAQALLDVLHGIEAAFGRTRVQRWGSRTLDLDLLAQGAQVLPDRGVFDHWRHLPLDQQIGVAPDRLILPHPRLQDRAFVLVPLCDIAPDWLHPVLKSTAKHMRDALDPQEFVEIRAL